MESVTLVTTNELNKLVEQLKNATADLTTHKKNYKDFVSNEEFILMMGISKRTAQTWRDEGLVAFSQISGKIYYSLADIEKLLRNHRHEEFINKKRA